MAFYNTGYCHFSKENMPRARESFVRFIELYPTQDGYRTDARNRLGDTYYSDRQFDEALKYYGQAAAASDDGADYARYQRAVLRSVFWDVHLKKSRRCSRLSATAGEITSTMRLTNWAVLS